MKIFITGTDTEIGKTYCTVGLLHVFKQLGLTTLGLKPIASGGSDKNGKFYNDDSLALQDAASIKIEHQYITPFSFKPAISPHIAANQLQQHLTLTTLNQNIRYSLTIDADMCLIEGFGGWHAPLNDTETMADFVISQQMAVILVVGVRLGCINHAILTYQAIKQSGLNFIGWIANCIDPEMLYRNENIMSLQKWIPEPCLGIIPYQHDAASCLKDLSSIFFQNTRIAGRKSTYYPIHQF